MKILKIICITLALLLCIKTDAIFLQYINPKGSRHHLSYEFISALTQELNIPNFIETGTFEGFTTEVALQLFSTINTFELSQDHYYRACEKFAHHAHVYTHWGDSGRLLRTILPKLTGHTLFWLDAHYSGGGTAFEGCGTPIIEELEAIRTNSNYKQSIIMIDDIRLFDLIPQRDSMGAGEGFPDMVEIFAKLVEINPDFSFALLGDTLMAYVSNKNITVSPVVQACTLSRLCKCFNLTDEEVRKLETAIYSASESEKSTFQMLHDIYCHPNSNTPSPYYHIWYGLTLLADKQFQQAALEFERAISLNYIQPRVQGYLQHALEEHAHYVQAHNAMIQQNLSILNLQKQNARYEQELMLYKQQHNVTIDTEINEISIQDQDEQKHDISEQ